MINIRVLTIFPSIFDSFLAYGNPARASQMGLANIEAIDLRQFADDARRTTDDYPYGGGIGMVMKPEPIVKGIRSVQGVNEEISVILLTPQGKRLSQQMVEELSQRTSLLMVCGRYEGIDERVRYFVNEEISIGDYVLSGGETAAMVLIDSIIRLIPGYWDPTAESVVILFTTDCWNILNIRDPESLKVLKCPAFFWRDITKRFVSGDERCQY